MPEARTRSALSAVFGRRVLIRPPDPVRDGSEATLRLCRIPGGGLDTVAAARALVRRHLPVKAAYAAMAKLFDAGEVDVEVPSVECMHRVTAELVALGIQVRHRSGAS